MNCAAFEPVEIISSKLYLFWAHRNYFKWSAPLPIAIMSGTLHFFQANPYYFMLPATCLNQLNNLLANCTFFHVVSISRCIHFYLHFWNVCVPFPCSIKCVHPIIAGNLWCDSKLSQLPLTNCQENTIALGSRPAVPRLKIKK